MRRQLRIHARLLRLSTLRIPAPCGMRALRLIQSNTLIPAAGGRRALQLILCCLISGPDGHQA